MEKYIKNSVKKKKVKKNQIKKRGPKEKPSKIPNTLVPHLLYFFGDFEENLSSSISTLNFVMIKQQTIKLEGSHNGALPIL